MNIMQGQVHTDQLMCKEYWVINARALGYLYHLDPRIGPRKTESDRRSVF